MTAEQEWARYMAANTRANRAYKTHIAQLDHLAIPLAERNRQKSARYYRTQTRKKK